MEVDKIMWENVSPIYHKTKASYMQNIILSRSLWKKQKDYVQDNMFRRTVLI